MRFFVALWLALFPLSVMAEGDWGGTYLLLPEEGVRRFTGEVPTWLPAFEVGVLPWHYRPTERTFALGHRFNFRRSPSYWGGEVAFSEEALSGIGDGIFSTPDMLAVSGQVAYASSRVDLFYAKSGMAWARAEVGVTEGRYGAVGYTYQPDNHFSLNVEALVFTFGETDTAVGSIAITGRLTW